MTRTPEQREAKKAYMRGYNRRKYATRSEEWKIVKNAEERERYKTRTQEQIERQRKHCVKYYKKDSTREKRRRKALKNYWGMSPEERRLHIQSVRARQIAMSDEQKKARDDRRRELYRQDPSKVRASLQRRRARIKGNGGSYTAQQWKDLLELCDHRCMRCGKREPEIKLTADHVCPLSKGGMNVIMNIQPLCFSCNSSKGNKFTFLEWPSSDAFSPSGMPFPIADVMIFKQETQNAE